MMNEEDDNEGLTWVEILPVVVVVFLFLCLM